MLAASISSADSRSSAREAITRLQRSEAAARMTAEMESIREAFLTAEEHLQRGDQLSAERYYLLTIQKSRILTSTLAGPPPPAAPATGEPPASAAPPPVTQPPPRRVKAMQPPADPAVQAPPQGYGDTYVNDRLVSSRLVGEASLYTCQRGDTLRLVAARLGVNRRHLTQMNRLDPQAHLVEGQKLRYNNRKIIPRRMRNGILINIADRTLYYFKEGKLATSLPVAVGMGKKGERADWATPTGKFRIVAKQKDPTWFVPPSIRSEMLDQGKEALASVPPGPKNPLGRYAIKTSLPGILIHSTTKPGSIYSYASHGCIRVSPERMEGFFREISVNTPGEIIYRPVKLAVTEEGRVFIEVHRDVYGKSTDLEEEAQRLIERHGLVDRVNWNKVGAEVRRKAGLAVDVTL